MSEWTIRNVLSWTAQRFAKAQLAQGRLDAEVLLAHALSMPRLQLYLDHDKPLAPQELTRYRQAIKRRLAGDPVAYIVGEREFWSLTLQVSPDVLIPRPESELLVELALRALRARGQDNAGEETIVADIGTGSGALAIALANESQATIWASDISESALAVARSNAARLAPALRFFQGDLLNALPHAARVDVLVANLPYIETAELETLEVARSEPKLALDGGTDGLDLLRRLIEQLPNVLADDGVLLLEIGCKQARAVCELLANQGRQAEVHQDLAGLDRVVSSGLPPPAKLTEADFPNAEEPVSGTDYSKLQDPPQ
ncbi:MAG: peptide chain release factor N(5)-glutamine methyltransferase [Deltaproteobacteria bacterium]|nr:peptide chain release factor N(5)-glutamine methyltransferase [Deltaproteobacteria bacterium]